MTAMVAPSAPNVASITSASLTAASITAPGLLAAPAALPSEAEATPTPDPRTRQERLSDPPTPADSAAGAAAMVALLSRAMWRPRPTPKAPNQPVTRGDCPALSKAFLESDQAKATRL
jgi:hypothetical protein